MKGRGTENGNHETALIFPIVPDLGIQKVDTSGVDLDQDVILRQLRVWHVANSDTIGTSVTIEDECLH